MKHIIFFLSFFLYSGYYAGLAIILALNLSALSRNYSLPIRMLLLLLMMIVIVKCRNQLVKNNSLPLIVFTLFWIFYILKVVLNYSADPFHQLSRSWAEYIFYALAYVVAPFITFYVIDFRKYKEVIVRGLIASGFVLGIVSTYLYGSYLGQDLGRLNMISYITGEQVLSPLALSYSGALTIALCIYKLLQKGNSKTARIYFISTIVLSFIMFLLGSSRGSVIALMLSLPLFVIFSKAHQKLAIVVLFIISIPIIIWAIESSGSSILDRIAGTSEDQGGGRSYLWSNAFSHFLENPILGGQVEIGGIYPHNLFIEILMATGLLGAILIFPLIFGGLKRAYDQVQADRSNLFLLLVLVQGLIQHLFTASIYTATLVFVPLAIVFQLQKQQRKVEDSPVKELTDGNYELNQKQK